MFSELVQLYQRVGVDIVGKSENPTAIRLTAELIGGSKCLLVIVEARLKCRAAQNSKKNKTFKAIVTAILLTPKVRQRFDRLHAAARLIGASLSAP